MSMDILLFYFILKFSGLYDICFILRVPFLIQQLTMGCCSSKPEEIIFDNSSNTPTPESHNALRESSASISCDSNVQVQPLSFISTDPTNNVHQDISNEISENNQITSSPKILPSTATNHVQIQPFLFKQANSVHQNNSSIISSHKNINSQIKVNRSSIKISACSSVTIISSADMKRFQQILYSALLKQSRILNWYYCVSNIVPTNGDFQVIRLQSGTYEYNNILEKFLSSLFGFIPSVIEILRVENPYLLGQYNLKKLEYQNKGLPTYERDLFHGTKGANVYNICSNNFNWRLHGRTRGNKFEQGVCFTPKSRYANHYCDFINDKVIILAKMLVSRTCEANKFMLIPDYYDKSRLLRYDTSMKENTNNVFVKYCDDEFYPAYLIHFIGKIFYPNKGNGYYR